jgi:glycosyltransferase involved in cell wall biosynthesis
MTATPWQSAPTDGEPAPHLPGPGDERDGGAVQRTRDPAEIARVTDGAAQAFLAANPGLGSPVVVVIPALNEAASVAQVVGTVPRSICGRDVDVLVVDDGSGDDTALEAARAGALVARLTTNTGQGSAFRLGYRVSVARGAEVIATADADGQFDPGELERLVRLIVDGEADLVTGSRRLGRAHTTDSVRSLGVVVFGGLISLLTGVRITDPANGLRAMTAEVARTVELRQPQYQSSELLITAIANGFRVREAPVTMYQRSAGRSKKGGNLVYGYRFSKVVFTTWWRQRDLARRNLAGRRGLW